MKHSLVFDADIAMAQAVADGVLCIACGASFIEAHGKAIACGTCWGMMDEEEKAATPRAWLEEANRMAWRRVMREKRESKWAGLAITTTRTEE